MKTIFTLLLLTISFNTNTAQDITATMAGDGIAYGFSVKKIAALLCLE
jgi:hypothetical protein